MIDEQTLKDLVKRDREKLVTLTDGRRGYFYSSPLAGTPMFQPTDARGRHNDTPELVSDEHEVGSTGRFA